MPPVVVLQSTYLILRAACPPWCCWSLQNCRPDPDYAPLAQDYAEMLRDAFKNTTDARSMRCIASLSKSYPATLPDAEKRPGDAKLGYNQVGAYSCHI